MKAQHFVHYRVVGWQPVPTIVEICTGLPPDAADQSLRVLWIINTPSAGEEQWEREAAAYSGGARHSCDALFRPVARRDNQDRGIAVIISLEATRGSVVVV